MKYMYSLKKTMLGVMVLVPAICFLFLYSCTEDPTLLGRNLLPGSDDFYTSYFEEEPIVSYSSNGKPISTLNYPFLMIGEYNDDIFGSSRSEFLAKLEIDTKVVKGPIHVQKMELNLFQVKYYGSKSPAGQTIRIYEFDDSMFAYPDTAGLESDIRDSLNAVYIELIGSSFLSDFEFEGHYNPVEIDHFTLPVDDSASLTFTINNPELKEKFENAPDSIYSDLGDFYDYFNALYFVPDDISDEGAIMYINPLHSKTSFKVFFTTDSIATLDSLVMDLGSDKYNRNYRFENDHTGSRSVFSLENPEASDTLMFISGMAGIRTKFAFPELSKWLNDSVPIAINSAKLRIPVDTSSAIAEKDFPSKLFIFTYDETEKYYEVYDYLVDRSLTYFGGEYDDDNKEYVFNLGVHLQAFLNKEEPFMNFVLVPENSIEPNRVVLKSPLGSDRKVKLEIVYSRF